MKLFLTLVLVCHISFSQIISSIDAFNLKSSFNYRLIHYPDDLPSEVSQTPLNGISYFNGIFMLDDDSQMGATIGMANANISFDGSSQSAWKMTNLHVFYKMFQNENSFFELGFILDLIEIESNDDAAAISNALASNLSNISLVIPDVNTFNAMFGQQFEMSENMFASHVSGLEILFYNGEGSTDDKPIYFRSNVSLNSRSNDLSFGINYKIRMYLAGIENSEPDFEDRFINTLIPHVSYDLNETFSLNLGLHIYTHEDLESYENRIEFGFTFLSL